MLRDDELLFLHEPARLLLLVTLCSVKEADFMFLLNTTELSRGNLSVQLRRLEERGWVRIDKTIKGRRPHTLCRITRAGRGVLRRYREQVFSALEPLEI